MDKHEPPERLTRFLTRASAIPGVAFARPVTRDGRTWYVDAVLGEIEGNDRAHERLMELVKELNEPADGLSFKVFSCREPGWSKVLASGDDLPVMTAPPSPLAEFEHVLSAIPGAMVEIREVDGFGYTVTVYNCGRKLYDEARRGLLRVADRQDMRVDVRDHVDEPPPGQRIRFVEEAP